MKNTKKKEQTKAIEIPTVKKSWAKELDEKTFAFFKGIFNKIKPKRLDKQKSVVKSYPKKEPLKKNRFVSLIEKIKEWRKRREQEKLERIMKEAQEKSKRFKMELENTNYDENIEKTKKEIRKLALHTLKNLKRGKK